MLDAAHEALSADERKTPDICKRQLGSQPCRRREQRATFRDDIVHEYELTSNES